jgi:single-strand DNA-binding protein
VYQRIEIIGNVGQDPELRYLASGVAVCSFSVAVNKRWTDSNTGERKEATTWFKVTSWRALAETCHEYVRKGMQIFVAGEVSASAYASAEGPKASLEVTASEIKFLSRQANDE